MDYQLGYGYVDKTELGIKAHFLCRNEQGAVIEAIGYARARGNDTVGVCIATSGPGATNLITGLGDALMDSIPVVAITGQVGSGLIGTDALRSNASRMPANSSSLAFTAASAAASG